MAMPSLMKRIFDPYQSAIDVRDTSQQTKQLGGYEQIMAEEYLKQNPETDWTGKPGFEAVQKNYNAKVLAQGGALYQKKTDEKGNERYSPKKGAKEKQDAETAANPMVMGKEGFEPASGQRLKDHIFGQIQKKRQMGMGISKGEANFEKKYLDIKDSDSAPTSGDDWDKTLKTAQDMVLADKISAKTSQMQTEGSMPDEISDQAELMKKMPVTFEEGVGSLAKALKFRYPNMPEEEIEKVTAKWAEKNESRWIPEYGVSLPEGMTDIVKIHTYLVNDLKMDPQEAAVWIQSRAEDLGVE